jgi:polar amino acid transport system substrate-binding protein
MVESATIVAERVGLQPVMAITPFMALIPSLTAGKIDMIAAALLKTPERARMVAFSEPVSSYAGGLVVRDTDRHRYANLVGLRGLRVGAQIGTRFIDHLHDAGIEDVATYDGLSDILRDLDHGRIDACYGDAPILSYQLRNGPHRKVRLVDEFVAPEKEQLCLVLRRADPRLGDINRAIRSLRATRIAQIGRKWGIE